MRLVLLLGILLSCQLTFAHGTEPGNYYEVDNLVLRGAALSADNVEWLKDRGVKTIIKLDDENMDELNWGIPVELLHINKFGLNLKYEFVLKILDKIEKAKSKGPVYIHCEHGADRTGLVVALYRVLHGWSIDEARDEMNAPRFGHSSLQVWMDIKFEDYSERLVNEMSY